MANRGRLGDAAGALTGLPGGADLRGAALLDKRLQPPQQKVAVFEDMDGTRWQYPCVAVEMFNEVTLRNLVESIARRTKDLVLEALANTATLEGEPETKPQSPASKPSGGPTVATPSELNPNE